jgi:two-component sensor histidine kinase
MSEGFALCEAIRDDSQRLVDYVVLDMNPALQQMLGVGSEAIGGKLSAAPGDQTAWLALCHRVLTTGKSATFEYHNTSTGRWHEVHVNRVTPTRMAQFFFDVTERKTAEAWQAKLFDELNHRVSNNLTIVSGILRMQAGRGDAALRAELLKAVDRVKSIADVHGSLYRAGGGEGIDFGPYLESLCGRLSQSLLADDRIRIEVQADSGVVPTDHAVPLGMLVNELVTNAVKYAYPAPEEGAVVVRFQVTDGGALLSVSDFGLGLPETFEAGRGGLGMTLVGFMTQQVGGHLTILRDRGTRFELRLGNPPSMASAVKP